MADGADENGWEHKYKELHALYEEYAAQTTAEIDSLAEDEKNLQTDLQTAKAKITQMEEKLEDAQRLTSHLRQQMAEAQERSQKELVSSREDRRSLKNTMRKLEQANDILERASRALQAQNEMQADKLETAIEEQTLLRSDIQDLMDARVTCDRCRRELKEPSVYMHTREDDRRASISVARRASFERAEQRRNSQDRERSELRRSSVEREKSIRRSSVEREKSLRKSSLERTQSFRRASLEREKSRRNSIEYEEQKKKHLQEEFSGNISQPPLRKNSGKNAVGNFVDRVAGLLRTSNRNVLKEAEDHKEASDFYASSLNTNTLSISPRKPSLAALKDSTTSSSSAASRHRSPSQRFGSPSRLATPERAFSSSHQESSPIPFSLPHIIRPPSPALSNAPRPALPNRPPPAAPRTHLSPSTSLSRLESSSEPPLTESTSSVTSMESIAVAHSPAESPVVSTANMIDITTSAFSSTITTVKAPSSSSTGHGLVLLDSSITLLDSPLSPLPTPSPPAVVLASGPSASSSATFSSSSGVDSLKSPLVDAPTGQTSTRTITAIGDYSLSSASSSHSMKSEARLPTEPTTSPILPSVSMHLPIDVSSEISSVSSETSSVSTTSTITAPPAPALFTASTVSVVSASTSSEAVSSVVTSSTAAITSSTLENVNKTLPVDVSAVIIADSSIVSVCIPSSSPSLTTTPTTTSTVITSVVSDHLDTPSSLPSSSSKYLLYPEVPSLVAAEDLLFDQMPTNAFTVSVLSDRVSRANEKLIKATVPTMSSATALPAPQLPQVRGRTSSPSTPSPLTPSPSRIPSPPMKKDSSKKAPTKITKIGSYTTPSRIPSPPTSGGTPLDKTPATPSNSAASPAVSESASPTSAPPSATSNSNLPSIHVSPYSNPNLTPSRVPLPANSTPSPRVSIPPLPARSSLASLSVSENLATSSSSIPLSPMDKITAILTSAKRRRTPSRVPPSPATTSTSTVTITTTTTTTTTTTATATITITPDDSSTEQKSTLDRITSILVKRSPPEIKKVLTRTPDGSLVWTTMGTPSPTFEKPKNFSSFPSSDHSDNSVSHAIPSDLPTSPALVHQKPEKNKAFHFSVDTNNIHALTKNSPSTNITSTPPPPPPLPLSPASSDSVLTPKPEVVTQTPSPPIALKALTPTSHPIVFSTTEFSFNPELSHFHIGSVVPRSDDDDEPSPTFSRRTFSRRVSTSRRYSGGVNTATHDSTPDLVTPGGSRRESLTFTTTIDPPPPRLDRNGVGADSLSSSATALVFATANHYSHFNFPRQEDTPPPPPSRMRRSTSHKSMAWISANFSAPTSPTGVRSQFPPWGRKDSDVPSELPVLEVERPNSHALNTPLRTSWARRLSWDGFDASRMHEQRRRNRTASLFYMDPLDITKNAMTEKARRTRTLAKSEDKSVLLPANSEEAAKRLLEEGEGVLHKQGDKHALGEAWKKCYFQINRVKRELTYSLVQSGGDFCSDYLVRIGAIPLPGARLGKVEDEDGLAIFTIEVVWSTKKYVLQADSMELRNLWVEQLTPIVQSKTSMVSAMESYLNLCRMDMGLLTDQKSEAGQNWFQSYVVLELGKLKYYDPSVATEDHSDPLKIVHLDRLGRLTMQSISTKRLKAITGFDAPEAHAFILFNSAGSHGYARACRAHNLKMPFSHNRTNSAPLSPLSLNVSSPTSSLLSPTSPVVPLTPSSADMASLVFSIGGQPSVRRTGDSAQPVDSPKESPDHPERNSDIVLPEDGVEPLCLILFSKSLELKTSWMDAFTSSPERIDKLPAIHVALCRSTSGM